MTELDKVIKALRLVEKYESYLFQKAWGMMLIVIGIAIPLSGFLNIVAPSLAPILKISADLLTALSTAIVWIIGGSIILYSFATATKLQSEKRAFSFRKEMPHIVAIILIWFISFGLLNFVPEDLGIVAILWAAGASCILSYLVLRRVHSNYPEILLVGVILLISSIPIAFISDLLVAEILTIVVFAISFVTGGFYSIFTASNALNKQ